MKIRYQSRLQSTLKDRAYIFFHVTKTKRIVCNVLLQKSYLNKQFKGIAENESLALKKAISYINIDLTELEIYKFLEKDNYFITVISRY